MQQTRQTQDKNRQKRGKRKEWKKGRKKAELAVKKSPTHSPAATRIANR